jgi:small subunit ribosomal protein S4
MARYTKAKHKLARREGINILGKASASLERRINVVPGSHSKRRGRKLSEYGTQLREKQKLKRTYGLTEKQFKKYAILAQKARENTIEVLIQELESRLDNVVYRLAFGKSRAQARQMVSHRHILVNDRKVNIPSYKVSQGDKITVSAKFPVITPEEEESEANIPEFLSKKEKEGTLTRKPNLADISNPVDYQLVIEFYSR